MRHFAITKTRTPLQVCYSRSCLRSDQILGQALSLLPTRAHAALPSAITHARSKHDRHRH